MSTSHNIAKLKHDYLEYFQDVPIQKYAAMAIGKSEDTIVRWKKRDKRFADAVQKSKAVWIRKKVLSTKAEFALERLETSIFGRKPTGFDLTVNVPTPIIYIPEELPYRVVESERL